MDQDITIYLAKAEESLRTADRRACVPLAGLCWYPIVSHPGWMMVETAPTGFLATSMRRVSALGYEPLARELRRQQTLFRDLLGAMEGEGQAPRLAKAYHADEHAALHRES